MTTFRATTWGLTILLCTLLFVGCSDSSSPTGPDSSNSDASGSNDGDGTSTEQFDSEAAPGNAARQFLDDSTYTTLKIEVDYMTGFEPTAEALDSLKSSLSDHVHKSTIDVDVSEIPAHGQSSYTTDQIRNLENQHRDQYTEATGNTIWAYFIVLDGNYSTENVLGIAYYNTSMAFFGQTIREISGGVTQPSREKVEATVFRHEFGHNLGLVNNGIPMQQDHQDDANGHHCTNEQCVLYHAIETTDYFSNLFDGTIPKFERFCSSDMNAQAGS